MTPSVVGAVLGLTAGLGGSLSLRRLPWLRRITLDDRLAPYLRDTTLPSTLLATRTAGTTPGHVSGTRTAMTWWHAHALPEMARRLGVAVGGSASVRARVDQLGTGSVEQVRLDQLVWGASALASVLALGLLEAVVGTPVQPVVLVLLCLLAGLGRV